MNAAKTERLSSVESLPATPTNSNGDVAIDAKAEASGEEDEEEKKKKPSLKDKLLKTFSLGPLAKKRGSKDSSSDEGKAETKEGEHDAEEANHSEAGEKKDEEKSAGVEAEEPLAKSGLEKKTDK